MGKKYFDITAIIFNYQFTKGMLKFFNLRNTKKKVRRNPRKRIYKIKIYIHFLQVKISLRK